MGNYSEREHGLAELKAVGTPIVMEEVTKDPCPHCGCAKLFVIQVVVEAPSMLRVPKGHEAVSTYGGCAACPWASKAMIVARKKES